MNLDALLGAAGRHGTVPLDLLVSLTLLSIVPLLLVMCTSFVRIVVVLSLVRSAIGASALPPNAVLTGLAMVLTFAIMAPTAARIRHDAIDPYGRARNRAVARVHASAGTGGRRSALRADRAPNGHRAAASAAHRSDPCIRRR